MFPQAIALAATWDVPLVERVAAAIARETGSRGIRQVLRNRIARDERLHLITPEERLAVAMARL